ncbi:sensor histidine kinase [Egbenema bharatensis]|uniref:sensor histidine kinase n=1 Tax=Egbenema bharatensis TaxID=3463334 RepID=UPI003A8A1593
MPHAQKTRTSHVLAVDDTPDNLFLIKAILGDEGYKVNVAKDGMDALDKIAQSPPDLILLDIMMPGMDGYEVTRRVRQNPALRYIPILLITAHEQSSVVEGLDAGADDFIRKPFDTDELLARVRSLLRLKHSIDDREKMSQQREDFVSRLTHDLRTPLVAADRMLHLFQEETFCPISPEMKDAIAAMIGSNQNLLQMVNTLLEVYRHEAGQKKLTFAPCDLGIVAQEIFQELHPLAQEKGIHLQMDVQPMANSLEKQEAIVLGDRLELRRVLTNLVGNAIKFTDTGFVKVRIFKDLKDPEYSTSQPSTNSTAWMVVEVEDTGSGISPEDQENLFKRFRKGKHKRADSGLGLYLSRCIVEGHGGTIHAQSTVGKGSLFTVHLPVTQA